MPSFAIRILRGTPPISSIRQGRFPYPKNSAYNDKIETISKSEHSGDFQINWIEEKIIDNVYSVDGTTSLKIKLEKTGYISYRNRGNTWYISNLDFRSKLFKNFLTPPFSIQPTSIDLLNAIKHPTLKNSILEYVKIKDLSIENIPSTKVEIRTCSSKDLSSLLQDTNASITSLAIELSTEDKLTISRSAIVKLRTSEIYWIDIVNRIHPIVESILED